MKHISNNWVHTYKYDCKKQAEKALQKAKELEQVKNERKKYV